MNIPRECFDTFAEWIEMWTEVYCLAAGSPVPVRCPEKDRYQGD